MTTGQTHWSVSGLLDLLDIQSDGTDRFVAQTGPVGADDRQVIEGARVLAQAIVAATKRFPGKSVRSVHGLFARAVFASAPVEFDFDVINDPDELGPPEMCAWVHYEPVTPDRLHRPDDPYCQLPRAGHLEGVVVVQPRESTSSTAGMSYVRGTVHNEQGELIASFTQDSIIRPLRTSEASIATSARL